MLIAVALVALGATPSLDFRLVSGTEWDTNPGRTLDSINADPDGGALLRLTADADATLKFDGGHRIGAQYLLGAKRFFDQAAEDVVVHDLSVRSRHGLHEWFSARTHASARLSRIRSGVRDYTAGSAGGDMTFHPSRLFALTGGASFSRLEFPPEDRLSHAGPTVTFSALISPLEALGFGARLQHDWRKFDGNAIVPVRVSDSLIVHSFCDGTDDVMGTCIARRRDDTVVEASVYGFYRAGFVLGAEASMRLQRSNSAFEDFNRFRLAAYGTVGLPGKVVLSVRGAVQFITQVSLTETNFRFLPEDDENQNRVEIQLGRKLTDNVGVDVRYALYANEFATADVRFIRQTFFGGMSLEL